MTGFGTNPIFGSHLLVLGLAGTLVLLLLITPNYRGLPKLRRNTLLTLRSALIALLTLAMLRPTIVNTLTTPQTAVLVVLFDKSRSMQQPAAGGKQSRWEAQGAVLQQIRSELAAFGEEFELRVYAYDGQTHPLDFEQGPLSDQTAPDGRDTDISSSLHEALQLELGRRVAGIVLMGDGAQTAIAPQVGMQESFRELGRLDSPLFSVAFGPTGDVAQARDISVENMPDRYTAFVKNQLDISAAIRVRGYVNKEIPVELIVEDERGEQTKIGPYPISARSDNELVPVNFPLIPDTPGSYKLMVRAASQAGELMSQNNELTAFLNVLDGGLRVLYLYGDLVGEQQLLRTSIDTAPDVQLDDQFINVINSSRWPIDLGRRLRTTKYDAVLLEAVDMTALSAADMKQLAELVSDGMGFMMIGGYSSFGAGGYGDTTISDVLPVAMSRFERQDLDPLRPISRDLHIWDDLVLKPLATHPVTLLAPESTNEQVWSTLPPLRGANKLRPKPAARVLLASQAGDPVLVAGTYGRGRVLAFGGNTTSRWWKYGREVEHRRFWRQSVLWLTHREDLERNDVWIDLPQRRYRLGTTIDFSAGVQSAGGEPVPDATLVGVIKAADGTSVSIPLRATGNDYRGQVDSPTLPGDYLIEVTASRGTETLGTARARLQLVEQDLELADPAADYEQLARFANATKQAGGRTLPPEELAEVLRELRLSYQDAEVELEAKWQLGDTATGAWILFLSMLGAAAGEWALRKKWGLV